MSSISKILGPTTLLFLVVILAVAAFSLPEMMPSDMKDSGAKCKYDDGLYMVKEKNDVWRAIMLPHTELGYTAQEVHVMEDGKVDFALIT